MLGSRKEKEKKVQEIKEDLQSASVIVLTDYRGLNVVQINNLRRMLQEEGIRYKVVKNTLTRMAAKEAGMEGLVQFLDGPTAIAYGEDDPVTPIKLLAKFSRDNEELEIKGGVVENAFLSHQDLVRLSELPPKEVLLSQVAGSFQAPLTGFLYVLQANLRGLVYALNGVKEQKEKEEQGQ